MHLVGVAVDIVCRDGLVGLVVELDLFQLDLVERGRVLDGRNELEPRLGGLFRRKVVLWERTQLHPLRYRRPSVES